MVKTSFLVDKFVFLKSVKIKITKINTKQSGKNLIIHWNFYVNIYKVKRGEFPKIKEFFPYNFF
jgi:hypothetical protein